MNIVSKKPNMVSFKNLSCGEVFKDEHSNYCMKIEPDSDANMVYLSDGALGMADDEDIFERIKCELVVSN